MVQEGDGLTVIPSQANSFFLSLIVAERQVKKVKQALEVHDFLDKSLKITPFILPTSGNHERLSFDSSPYSTENNRKDYAIPTKFRLDRTGLPISETQIANLKDTVLQKIRLGDQPGIKAQLTLHSHPSEQFNESNKSPLLRAVRQWLHSLPENVHSKLPDGLDNLLNACKWTYTVYTPMLLLPPSFLSKDPWPDLLANTLKPHVPELYNTICRHLRITHIAINGPIPALLPNFESISTSNILRSPANLVPLHGAFGKSDLPPTKENYHDAFWVSAIQNGIRQIWAPLQTMFSRGNISEKTRLLKLVSASPAQESTAVDLYAGIGYFAFSYAKAGVNKILCWELNGWSIEGLRRGAKKNGWGIKVVNDAQKESIMDDSNQDPIEIGEERFLVFYESNTNAPERVQKLRHKIPPVRHVNCGYLPSSSESWHVAVQVVDPVIGGWIHVHENVPIKNIEERKSETVKIFRDLVHRYCTQNPASTFTVECQHVEQVKAYAPGIIHCVFDISILPYTA